MMLKPIGFNRKATGGGGGGGVLDDFNRSNENLEADANWSTITGHEANSMQIVSNELQFSGDFGRGWCLHGDTRAADHWAELEYRSDNATNLYEGGPVIGLQDGGSGATGWFLNCQPASSQVVIAFLDNGSYSQEQVYGSVTFTAGDVFRLSRTGTTLTATKNGVSLGSTLETFGGASGGGAGVSCSCGSGGTINFDNFDAGDV